MAGVELLGCNLELLRCGLHLGVLEVGLLLWVLERLLL